jgi:hypothetical protein
LLGFANARAALYYLLGAEAFPVGFSRVDDEPLVSPVFGEFFFDFIFFPLESLVELELLVELDPLVELEPAVEFELLELPPAAELSPP